MACYLVIVSREQAELGDYLRDAFSGDDKVRIILDRRRAGDQRLPAWAVERRRVDRRSQRGIEHELHIMGFAITRASDPVPGADRRAADNARSEECRELHAGRVSP